MRKQSILSAFAVVITTIACYEIAMTNSTSPPVSRTGAPGEGTCSDCHGNLNTGPGNILLSLDTVQYIPGNTYSASLLVVDGGKSRFGFQITVLDSNDNMAGSFIVTNPGNTTAQTSMGRDYVTHQNANATSIWQFDWVSPGSDLGPLTFYVAGNGADNDGTSTGDNTYTRTFTIQSCTVNPSIAGDNVTCNGGNDGSANSTTTGGDPPYTYLWSTSDTTEDISSLTAGVYSLTVTDSLGCMVTDSVVITEPLPIGATYTVINPSCNGSCDGIATALPFGGTGNQWILLWGNGDTGITATGLCAGTLTLIITDSAGCTAMDTGIITEPAALVNAGIPINMSCFGLCDGVVTADMLGGTPPYTYLWNTLQTTSTLSGLCAGTYFVTVTDSNNCVYSDSSIIIEPPLLSASIISKSDEICNGACDGGAAVSVTGGVTPYTYTWSGGCASSSCTSLCTGNFSVTVTDNSGCTVLINDSIQGPAPMSNTNGSTNSTCTVADGSAFINESGGVQPYTYLWDDPLAQTTDSAINLFAGNYTVLVTDSNGCIDSATVNVSDAGSPVIITDSLVSASCNGSSDGAIFISVAGGIVPLTYSWDNGETTEDISGLIAGTYIVSVYDSIGCSSNESMVVAEPGLIVPAVDSITNVTCVGDATGAASISTAGGTTPYTFTWQNASLDTIGANSNILSGVTEGNYMVTVVDSIGCTGSTSLYIAATTSLANIHFSTTNISCNGVSDGSASISISSSIISGPLSYTATSNYNTYYNFPPLQDLSYINDGDLDSGAAWGPSAPYPFELTLNFGQSVILDSVKIKAGQINGDFNVPELMVLYNGTSSGTVISTITPTYNFDSYSLSNATGNSIYTFVITPALDGYAGILEIECYGTVELIDSTLTYLWNGPNGFTSGNSSVTGLEAGAYFVLVSNVSACTLTDSVELIEPDSLLLAVTGVNLSCNSSCDGNSNAQVAGGTTPYNYLWTLQGTPVDSIFFMNSLCVGTYTIQVTDDNGCVIMDSTAITQPDSLAVSLSVTNISCYKGSNGTATAVAAGGIPPYSYSWDDPSIQSNSVAGGLSAAIYSVAITDSNGCIFGSSSSVKQGYFPASDYNNFYTTNDLTNINDGDLNEGTIWAAPVPSAFELSMTFPTAVVINTVKLRAGQFSGDFYAPALMELHRGNSSGPIIASIAPTYSFDLYNIINITADNIYTWVITPADTFVAIREIECYEVTDPAYVVVSEPTELLLSDSTTIQSSPGAGDASIDLTVSGGTLPYTYSWSTGDSIEDLSSLVGGNYTVIVTDSNGCTETLIINIPGAIGMQETNENIGEIGIYPNPNDGNFVLAFNCTQEQNIKLVITDIKGQIVYVESVNSFKGSYKITIAVESLLPGIYLLQMITASELYTRKLVIR